MVVAHAVQIAKIIYVPLTAHASIVLIRSLDHIVNGLVFPIAKILSVTGMAVAFHAKMSTFLVLHVDGVVETLSKDVIHVMD